MDLLNVAKEEGWLKDLAIFRLSLHHDKNLEVLEVQKFKSYEFYPKGVMK